MNLLERILKQNPWWENKKIEEIKNYKERFLLKEIWKYKDSPQILAILGLRRTGKTVLIWQIIQKLLKKTPAKKILYFSFDEILGKDPEIIEKVLEAYENEILKQELKNVFIFLDEVNYLKNWQVILKRYYDLPGRIKFFVSGSSSIYLKKTKESLAGRIYEFHLLPISFKEHLYLKNIKTESPLILKRELNKYFLSGTFPEIINETDFSKIKKYINSLVDKIIFYDIPKVYDIEEPEILKNIFGLIAQKPGMLLEYQNLASIFRISYQTVSKYINYLEKSYLIKRVYNFRGSVVARARKLKKVYLISPNLACGFLDSEKEFLNILPALAENTVCSHLDAPWFWRKYNELDFYDQEKAKAKAIEVKYADAKPDIKNNILAVKNLKARQLLIITRNFENQETIQDIKINYMPLWKWLLRLK